MKGTFFKIQLSKEMTTQEKNEIIARWMGFNKDYVHKKYGQMYSHPDRIGVLSVDKFEYHSSWDWLMPVVEKIESLGFKFTIHNDAAIIERTFNRDFKQGQYLSNIGKDKKESTFNAAFNFIEWYEWYNANVKEKLII